AAKNADAAHNVEQALTYYLRLYAQTGGQKEYGLILARLWSQKGNHAEAAAVLAPIMEDHPSLEQRRQFALELLLAQNFSQSLKAYHQAWEAGDSHKETILNLARLHARQEQFRQAAIFWDEARRRQLLDPELRREAALTYSYARRYRDAISILQNVDRRDPKLLLFLGQMHFYQKDWDQAAHYYQEYLTQVPQDAAARQQLAQALSYAPGRLAEAASEYENTAKMTGDPQLRLQKAAVLLQLAQDASDNPRQHDQAPAKWAAASAALQQLPAQDLPPELIREQARLLLWLGELEPALDRLDKYLAQDPQDRHALLERARILIYLQRGTEAAEVLRRLPPKKSSPALINVPCKPQSQYSPPLNLSSEDPDDFGNTRESRYASRAATAEQVTAVAREESAVVGGFSPDIKTAADSSFLLSPRGERGVRNSAIPPAPPADVLTLFLEAALADRNWPEAQRRAWQLYLTQLSDTSPRPQTWTAARRRLQEDNHPELSPETRVAIARALCHQPTLNQEQDSARMAIDLCLANLLNYKASEPAAPRTYQASCLLLRYLLPRLSHFDDLQNLIHRLPGL
ncbi:MAG TPA: tetratricopeptide repeat protein, partial [Thermodesulfobacteriota bacterium]|nr:tetratricopeptide repeat protein [Thermodesulfobacteriota bacterium]